MAVKKPKKVSKTSKAPAPKSSKTTKSFRSSTSKDEKKKKVPEGAEITRKSVDTSVKEIENGYIVSKSYDVSFKPKGSNNSDYAYWTDEYYTKEDPLTITFNDKALAEKFEEDD